MIFTLWEMAYRNWPVGAVILILIMLPKALDILSEVMMRMWGWIVTAGILVLSLLFQYVVNPLIASSKSKKEER